MTYTGPLEDRIAIRELIESYNDAVALRDARAWSQTWAEDGEWDILGQTIGGRTAIVAFWETLMAAYPFAGFMGAPGAITVEGDRATARVHTVEELISADGAVTRIRGRYDDELIRRDGRWLFQRRCYTIVHQQQSSTQNPDS